jgi:hypothetical protein
MADQPEAEDRHPAGTLIFSVQTWQGDDTSKDIPGGVETTPVEGAIYTIKADGTGLKKIGDWPKLDSCSDPQKGATRRGRGPGVPHAVSPSRYNR